MELAQSRRGEYKDMRYLVQGRTTLVYELPLAELVNDFFDHLKSRSKGYASMEYSFIGYRENDLVRLDVAINNEPVDALSCIVHREKSYTVGKALVTKLKEIVPRAQFKIPIQAKIGAKVVASQQISALKKGMLLWHVYPLTALCTYLNQQCIQYVSLCDTLKLTLDCVPIVFFNIRYYRCYCKVCYPSITHALSQTGSHNVAII